MRKTTAIFALIFCLTIGTASASPVGRALNSYNYQSSINTAVVYQINSNHLSGGGTYTGYTGKGVDTYYYGGETQFDDCGPDGSTNPAAVPEPMSALLMLLGMGGAAALRRKMIS